MISSELPEILGMSDRIAVMHAGSVAGVLARAGSDAGAHPGAGARRRSTPQMTPRTRARSRCVIAILLLGGGAGVASRPASSRPANLRDLLLANMPVLIVALGMTLVILTGEIDISVGSQFAICSVVAGVLGESGLPASCSPALAACLTGALLGAINGALVAWLRIPSIVVTLATMVALRDGLRWVTQGAWVQDLPPDFQWLRPVASRQPGDHDRASPLLLCRRRSRWGLRHLAAGRAVYATGSNPEGARLAGIEPARVVFWVFIADGRAHRLRRAAQFRALQPDPEQRRHRPGDEGDRGGGRRRRRDHGRARHRRGHAARRHPAGR